jgi:MFS family permease
LNGANGSTKPTTVVTQTRRDLVALLLTVQLLSGIVISPQRSFFPVYAEELLGYTAASISALVAMGQLAGMFASVLGGALSDALGRKWTLALGLAGCALASLTFLVHAPWLVATFWCFGGLALGLHTLGGQSYLIDAVGSQHLGAISALHNWGFIFGGALGSPIAGSILDKHTFSTFGLILLAISLTTILGMAALLPSLRRGGTQRTSLWNRPLFGYGDVVRRPTVIILGLLRFLPTCYWGMAGVLIPLLIHRKAGDKTAVALYATISLVMASLAQMLAGRTADRWGCRGPTLVAFGLLIFSTIGLASFATYLWSFYLFGVLAACAAWSLSTLMPSLVADATSVEERGRVLGVVSLLWNVGMMVGSLTGGVLVEMAVGLPFLVAGLLNLGAILLAVSFFRLLSQESRQMIPGKRPGGPVIFNEEK